MLLTNRDHSVELRPLRYQFPAVSGDWYDDNWLDVQGEITTPEGSWSFIDPCLLVDEAHAVSTWLRTAATAAPAPDLSFIEPVLSFGRSDRHDDGTLAVTIHFSHEAAPPWLHRDDRLDPYPVQFTLTAAALCQAADTWDRHLARFPTR
ncbi:MULTISPECIES: hypothetical protein [unclassified Streptomyces]|uniref:WapI family immunity protein n=1 Tax=unclassified Streptomyces TaxID=2593676 RepID=UPI00336A307C